MNDPKIRINATREVRYSAGNVVERVLINPYNSRYSTPFISLNMQMPKENDGSRLVKSAIGGHYVVESGKSNVVLLKAAAMEVKSISDYLLLVGERHDVLQTSVSESSIMAERMNARVFSPARTGGAVHSRMQTQKFTTIPLTFNY